MRCIARLQERYNTTGLPWDCRKIWFSSAQVPRCIEEGKDSACFLPQQTQHSVCDLPSGPGADDRDEASAASSSRIVNMSRQSYVDDGACQSIVECGTEATAQSQICSSPLHPPPRFYIAPLPEPGMGTFREGEIVGCPLPAIFYKVACENQEYKILSRS